MTTYEICIDNAKIQTHCHVEPPSALYSCDEWNSPALSDAIFVRRLSSFDLYGQFIDGVIIPNPAATPDYSDYYFPGLEMDPDSYYMFEVTFDPDSSHDNGNRDVYITSARPGYEITDFDSSYGTFTGHHPWGNLYWSKIWDTFGDVKRFVIGPGIESWDDPTFGPTAGQTVPIFETEGGAVSQVRVMKVCTWIEEEYEWKISTGTPPQTHELVGASTDHEALSDSSDSTYIRLISGTGGTGVHLAVVPKDLMDNVWERHWLEFDVEVEGGGTSQFNWEIHFSAIGNDSQNAGTWNTPVTVSSGVLKQTIPLSFNTWPNGGDTGDWDSEFSPENVIYQASRDDSSREWIWLDVYVNNAPTISPIRIKRLVYKIARPFVV